MPGYRSAGPGEGGAGTARATQPRPVLSDGRIVGTAPSRRQMRSSSRWQMSRVPPRTMYTTSSMPAVSLLPAGLGYRFAPTHDSSSVVRSICNVAGVTISVAVYPAHTVSPNVSSVLPLHSAATYASDAFSTASTSFIDRG
ncbi:hypothetical protein SUDANB1_00453 [Streptomyces sp. enrichment culture]